MDPKQKYIVFFHDSTKHNTCGWKGGRETTIACHVMSCHVDNFASSDPWASHAGDITTHLHGLAAEAIIFGFEGFG